MQVKLSNSHIQPPNLNPAVQIQISLSKSILFCPNLFQFIQIQYNIVKSKSVCPNIDWFNQSQISLSEFIAICQNSNHQNPPQSSQASPYQSSQTFYREFVHYDISTYHVCPSLFLSFTGNIDLCALILTLPNKSFMFHVSTGLYWVWVRNTIRDNSWVRI